MSELLFLVHRVPFPPDKGDKIRSFNLLRALASRYRVHLGAFVDCAADLKHQKKLHEIAAGEVKLLYLPRTPALIRGALSMARAEPLTFGFYRRPEMYRWVEDLLARRPISRVVIFSSSMAPYAQAALQADLPCVADYCDVDSEKWDQYAAGATWPLSVLYRREAQSLRSGERRFAERFASTLFVARSELELFATRTGVDPSLLDVVPNGVDTVYFNPHESFDSPFAPGERGVVFTGAMDYRANVDAVCWFADEVWPAILERTPAARFFIVGSNPAPAVRKLGGRAGIAVTGTVPDVRPYLRHCCAVVAPLRIARGVQNKVLEGMAMECSVIASPAALTGLRGAQEVKGVVTAASASEFAELVTMRLNAGRIPQLAARRFVSQHYSWESSLSRFLDIVENAGRCESHLGGERAVVNAGARA